MKLCAHLATIHLHGIALLWVQREREIERKLSSIVWIMGSRVFSMVRQQKKYGWMKRCGEKFLEINSNKCLIVQLNFSVSVSLGNVIKSRNAYMYPIRINISIGLVYASCITYTRIPRIIPRKLLINLVTRALCDNTRPKPKPALTKSYHKLHTNWSVNQIYAFYKRPINHCFKPFSLLNNSLSLGVLCIANSMQVIKIHFNLMTAYMTRANDIPNTE